MIIGVTGGIGAGKSTVLDILKEEYDAKLILCDEVAKDLQRPSGASYNEIVKYFGTQILKGAEGSEIDRGVLSNIVFNDEEKLKALNSMTHPLVKEEVTHLINKYYSENPDNIIVIEAALLLEAGYQNILDEMWCVIADNEVRINRLIKSRGYTRQRAIDMMAAQKTNEEFIKSCDFAVYNSNDLDQTKKQITQRIEYLKHNLA